MARSPVRSMPYHPTAAVGINEVPPSRPGTQSSTPKATPAEPIPFPRFLASPTCLPALTMTTKPTRKFLEYKTENPFLLEARELVKADRTRLSAFPPPLPRLRDDGRSPPLPLRRWKSRPNSTAIPISLDAAAKIKVLKAVREVNRPRWAKPRSPCGSRFQGHQRKAFPKRGKPPTLRRPLKEVAQGHRPSVSLR